ncbi:MAG: glycogen-binding domain-containing protein, partial [Longimicrobiales bacterium]|nr:glycogen-binding domain-containing protein [Longimicrobiales bacterium]
GVGAAVARNSLDDGTVSALSPNVGVWLRRGPARVTLSGLLTRLEGASWPEANLTVALSRGAVDVTAFGGVRDDPFSDLAPTGSWWAGASAAAWITPRAALVVSGGRYAPDILQGIPGGDYFTLGFRITARRARPVPPDIPVPLVFSRERAESGGIGFRLPAARSVAIVGDWNDWTPAPLRADGGGRWVLTEPVPPGVHRFNLVVDGERWVVPDDVPRIDDGFGGSVGLLVVSAS